MITELIRKDGLRKQTISQQGNQTQQRWKLKLYTKTIGVNISIKKEMADIVASSDVYTVKRYYRRSKSIPSLPNLIFQVK